MIKKIQKWGQSLTVLLVALVCLSGYAYADITITPTGILFEDRDRFKDVTLVNSGDEQKTYEIGWQFFRMVDGDAAAYELTESSITDFDLSQYIVYTPRRVTLSPGSKQKIRLALRRPAEVPPGEYRAHLTFRMVREDEPVSPDGGGEKKASAAVKINVGYSIPVLFHAGTPNVTANIESMQLERNQNSGRLMAKVRVNRQGGPYGILGHIYIYNAQDEVIGEIGNANVFSEVSGRTFNVPLMNENISGSTLRVVIGRAGRDQNGIYAERSFPIQ